jgi:CheY-like chemotaxis protein
MSGSSLAAIWIAALLPGTAVIVLVLVKRAAGAHEEPRATLPREVAVPAPKVAGADVVPGRAETDRSRDLLLLRMSHDLRGPLGSVVTLCQLLVDGDAGPLSMKQRQYVEVMWRSGQSVLALVDDILDLAAVESGRSDIDAEAIDLAALLRPLAESYEAAGREKGISVQLSLPHASIPVSCDPRRLRHLIERMVEHVLSMTDHGYVEIAVSEADANVLVRVRNTADGATDSARRTVELGDGTDGGGEESTEDGVVPLPIAVAARLARRIGLPIRVKSGPDDGLLLELAVPPAPAGALVSSDLTRPARRTGARILLVDDDAAERLHVTARLEEVGYEVTAASSGSEGLARLRDGQFDAVVLDLVMPGLSGLEVLRAARTDERLASLPFVVLSALYITRSERAVLGPAVASVVRKGDATADELLQALDRALAPAGPTHAIGADRHV